MFGGGGRLLRNGNEVLDKKNGAGIDASNLSDKNVESWIKKLITIKIAGSGIGVKDGVISSEHPIGSYHICKTGSENPAIKFGGTWRQVASNVVLPLGSLAPVLNDGASSGNPSLAIGQINKSGNYDLKVASNLVYIANNSSATTSAILKTDLAQATTKISGVDIWLREA